MAKEEEAARLAEEAFEQKGKESFLSRLVADKKTLLIIILLGFGTIYFMIPSEGSITEWSSNKKVGIVIALILLIVFISRNRDMFGSDLLGQREAKAILLSELQWMQDHSKEVPSGVIIVGPTCNMRYFARDPWYWAIAASIRATDGRVFYYSCGVFASGKERGEIKCMTPEACALSIDAIPDIAFIDPDYSEFLRRARGEKLKEVSGWR